MIKAYFNKRTLIYTLELIVLFTMLIVVLVASVAVIFTLFKCFKFDFVGNLNGIIFFINQFDQIKELIAGTLAIIALFFIIERINLMGEANYSAAREVWKGEFTKKIEEMRIENPYMAIYFEQISDQLYKYLLKRNFTIYNKLMLRYFYYKFISDQVIEFEKNSKKSINQGGRYSSREIVYSLDEAQKLTEFIFRLSHYYRTLIPDFTLLYSTKVQSYAEKHIQSN